MSADSTVARREGGRREDRVAGLLLAAGAGTRLGRPKALVDIGGQRLVDRGVQLLRAGGCEPVFVVLGAATTAVPGVRVVHNPDWASGMGSSLRRGLAALPPHPDAVVVALVDQPLVRPEAIRRLVAAHDAGAVVAVATYAGEPRNPVLLARQVWADAAAAATGDLGARGFLRARPELVTTVACDDVGAPDDVDTPADLDRLRTSDFHRADANPRGGDRADSHDP